MNKRLIIRWAIILFIIGVPFFLFFSIFGMRINNEQYSTSRVMADIRMKIFYSKDFIDPKVIKVDDNILAGLKTKKLIKPGFVQKGFPVEYSSPLVPSVTLTVECIVHWEVYELNGCERNRVSLKGIKFPSVVVIEVNRAENQYAWDQDSVMVDNGQFIYLKSFGEAGYFVSKPLFIIDPSEFMNK